jgi:hypothetical protein
MSSVEEWEDATRDLHYAGAMAGLPTEPTSGTVSALSAIYQELAKREHGPWSPGCHLDPPPPPRAVLPNTVTPADIGLMTRAIRNGTTLHQAFADHVGDCLTEPERTQQP